jgi:hypothetical protein
MQQHQLLLLHRLASLARNIKPRTVLVLPVNHGDEDDALMHDAYAHDEKNHIYIRIFFLLLTSDDVGPGGGVVKR